MAYFHLCLLPISATCLTSAFRRRTVISLASQLSRFEQHPNNITVPVQVLTENWQLRTDNCFSAPSKFYGQAERAISTGKLHALLRFNLQPINLVVFQGPSLPLGLGDLILGRASRLYAFSGYHNRTSLPSGAIGMTARTQEVRPSRSSRTKDRSSQISCAHNR